MTNFAGAQPQAKKFTNQNDQSPDVHEIRDSLTDVRNSVGHWPADSTNALRTWQPTQSKNPAMQFNVTP